MIFAIVLWLLGVLVLGVFLVLVLPMRVRMHAQTQPNWRLRLELGLLGGGVPWLAMVDTARGRGRNGAKTPAKPRRNRTKRRGLNAARGRRMLRAAPGLLHGLLGLVRLERVEIDCIFGTGDPADTGEMFGLLAPVPYWFAGARRGSVRIEPDFGSARFDGKVDVTMALVPIRLLRPLFRFGWAVLGPMR